MILFLVGDEQLTAHIAAHIETIDTKTKVFIITILS